jgi:hypothetical protein
MVLPYPLGNNSLWRVPFWWLWALYSHPLQLLRFARWQLWQSTSLHWTSRTKEDHVEGLLNENRMGTSENTATTPLDIIALKAHVTRLVINQDEMEQRVAIPLAIQAEMIALQTQITGSLTIWMVNLLANQANTFLLPTPHQYLIVF